MSDEHRHSGQHQQDELRAGARALSALIVAIRDVTTAQAEAAVNEDGNFSDDGSDFRDYALFARLIEQSLQNDFVNAAEAHRTGYLRALSELFSRIADDVCPPSVDKLDTWDPIAVTEAAFVADRGMRLILDRATSR
ncbi:MAG: hypothetical protein HS128_10190 [Ideonella sp.]|nr:hypothetical protein [Ideonella sp.]